MNDAYHQLPSSIKTDGSREKIRIADVRGRFQIKKKLIFFVLVFIYAIVPWLNFRGHPLILVDIWHREFFLLGQTYNAQDFYLVFFLVSGILFTLFYITALAGRIWCGYACPHTVFLEGIYRKIERWVEGPRAQQLLLANGPWNKKKTTRFILKHFLYLLVSVVIAHIFLSYFVSLDHLFIWIRKNPNEHSIAFGWMLALTGVMYLNFAWFREQMCLIVCPYGRIQSALIDDDSLIIGYDIKRGEPRGKKNDSGRGDCINCHRCVDVCPTGIDIREGLQLECVGCANCVDACDEVMLKIGQKEGLIRYDSLNGLSGLARKILRPRIYLYTVLFVIGMLVFGFFLSNRYSFEANVLRLSDKPYELVDHKIRNQFKIHLVNKNSASDNYHISFSEIEGIHFILPINDVQLKSMEDRQIPFFVEFDAEKFKGDFDIIVLVSQLSNQEEKKFKITFVGPHQ